MSEDFSNYSSRGRVLCARAALLPSCTPAEPHAPSRLRSAAALLAPRAVIITSRPCIPKPVHHQHAHAH